MTEMFCMEVMWIFPDLFKATSRILRPPAVVKGSGTAGAKGVLREA
jgi:hypothetical protein